MRVLVVTNMFPPHHYGGYEINCAEACDAFRRAGHDVAVLTSDHRVPGVEDEVEETAVQRELRLYWDDHQMVRPSVRSALDIERHNQAALLRAIEQHRPDLVSAWHLGALSLGLLVTCHRLGLPVVHVVNDDWLVYGPEVDRWNRSWRRLGPLAALAERALGVPCGHRRLGRDGSFCLISESVRQAAESTGITFTSAIVGHCGINIDDFPVGIHAPRASWSWRLLHVGRIDERKGIDTAIEALALLPDDATLDVLGRGDDAHLAALHALAGRAGVAERVRFGVAARGELGGRYAAADAVLFLPRWGEPFGLVPLEAMACSTPVIATATGGSAEFLADEANALVVPRDDPAAVADAVRRLADDADLRAQLVAGGLETASAFTLPRWLDLLLDLHTRAAASF